MNELQTAEDFNHAASDYGPLTQRQAENIADLAARRAEERMYLRVGRNVVTRAIWAVGAAMCSLAVWLSGWVHFGPPK